MHTVWAQRREEVLNDWGEPEWHLVRPQQPVVSTVYAIHDAVSS
jgi:hypothetical protein